jgi:hypothetical protein
MLAYLLLPYFIPPINISSFVYIFHSIMQVYTNKKHIKNLPSSKPTLFFPNPSATNPTKNLSKELSF